MRKDIFENNTFLGYLNQSNDVHPLSISLEVTNNCNFRCCHCFIKHSFSGKEGMMSFEKIKDIINQIADYGVPILYLTGGEALIRNDITDIVAYGKQCGLTINLKTNGSLFTDRILDSFADSGIDTIQVSLYGMNDSEYKGVTGYKGTDDIFATIKRNVEGIISRNIKIDLTHITLKENYKSCVNFVGWCKELGLKPEQYHNSTEIHPENTGNIEPTDHALSIEEKKELIEELLAYDKDYAKRIYKIPRGFRKCNVGKHAIQITHNGEVYPCAGFPISLGSIYNLSYKEIWENSPELNMLREFKVDELDCNTCETNSFCLCRCIGVLFNWNKHTSFKNMNPIHCEIQRKNADLLRSFPELIRVIP